MSAPVSPPPSSPVNHAPGRHYEIQGHRLWVETEGDGEPLLLLAGLGPAGSHVIFHPFFTGLAGTHRVIYVDLHGRGRSDRPADLAEITFAGDVADVAGLIGELAWGRCTSTDSPTEGCSARRSRLITRSYCGR